MSYIARILAALVLGLYSTVGLHYYSVLISWTKNEWIRIVYFLTAVAVLIFLPMIICVWLLVPHPLPASLGLQRLWFAVVLLVWLSVIWIYLIKNWRPLKARLRPHT